MKIKMEYNKITCMTHNIVLTKCSPFLSLCYVSEYRFKTHNIVLTKCNSMNSF